MNKTCRECGIEFVCTVDEAKWKTKCRDCFIKAKTECEGEEDIAVKRADEKYNVVPIKTYKFDGRDLRIFKGQCFNAAVELMKQKQITPIDSDESINWIYATADKLYKKGIERGWLE